MSLDLADLKIFQEAGSVNEKYYASKIYPLRKHGNFLLCSILLSNTLVNCAQTIILDSIVHGIYATITATLLIVIFGEIIPQAICGRHGLAIGAKTAWFIKCVMLITSPMSFPFGKCLDWALGKQGPTAYNREKIRVLLREQTSDVEPEEMDIIAGVLALRDKTAEQHMQKLGEVFMVDASDMVDEKLYTRIYGSGYSRIPVFKLERCNIIGVLHVKDLALTSAYQNQSVGSICDSFKLPFGICQPTDGLFTLLRYIVENHYHMLLVQKHLKDPIKEAVETVGVITLEDIIEEMIHLEILDEFDASVEQKRNRYGKFKSVPVRGKVSMPSHLKIGCMQVMSALPPFKEDQMSQEVLSRLIDQHYVEERNCQRKPLYEYGKANDSFTILINGTASFEAGTEKLRFEVSYFATFGISSLEAEGDRRAGPFIPDYSVYLSGDMSYVRIPRSKWLAVTRLSAFEKREPEPTNQGGTVIHSRSLLLATDIGVADSSPNNSVHKSNLEKEPATSTVPMLETSCPVESIDTRQLRFFRNFFIDRHRKRFNP